MSSTQVGSESAVEIPTVRRVDMKLEVVVIPVSDVDRAKRFTAAWADGSMPTTPSDDGSFRIIQFTPPRSGCSVSVGRNVAAAAPGSAQGLCLIVSDVAAARNALLGCVPPLTKKPRAPTLPTRCTGQPRQCPESPGI